MENERAEDIAGAGVRPQTSSNGLRLAKLLLSRIERLRLRPGRSIPRNHRAAEAGVLRAEQSRPGWTKNFPWARRQTEEAAFTRDPELIAAVQPFCAEAWAHLKLVWEQGLAPFAVSSVLPNLPVPLLAYGLALAAGSSEQSGAQVLLIDADLEERPLQTLSGNTSGPGLSDALKSGLPLEGAILNIAPGVAFLPAGTDRISIADASTWANMQPLLDEVNTKFAHVIVPAPPISRGADALMVAAQIGNVVLAVSSDVPTTEAKRAKASLMAAGAHIRGLLYLDRT